MTALENPLLLVEVVMELLLYAKHRHRGRVAGMAAGGKAAASQTMRDKTKGTTEYVNMTAQSSN